MGYKNPLMPLPMYDQVLVLDFSEIHQIIYRKGLEIQLDV